MAAEWWLEPGFIAFDTETTGVDASVERIVTAAAIRYRGGEIVAERSWLIAVDVPIPPASTAVHGITDALSQGSGMEQRAALADIRAHLVDAGVPIVAFNSEFDLQMLDANLRRVGLEPLGAVPAVCPYVIDKQCNKYVKGSNQRRLAPTAARYDIELTEEDWHGADADAKVAAQILLAEMAAYPQLRDLELDVLVAEIGKWRAQQEADFQAWLASRR